MVCFSEKTIHLPELCGTGSGWERHISKLTLFWLDLGSRGGARRALDSFSGEEEADAMCSPSVPHSTLPCCTFSTRDSAPRGSLHLPTSTGRRQSIVWFGMRGEPAKGAGAGGPSFVRRPRAAPPLGGSLLPAEPDNRRGWGAARSGNFPRGRRRLGPAMEEGASAAPPLWNWDYLERCFARRRVCISFGLWICAACCWIAAHTL